MAPSAITDATGEQSTTENSTALADATHNKASSSSKEIQQHAEFSIPVSLENSEKRFQDVDVSKILVIEVFAGTGRLTSALRDRGFRTMAVDRDKTRSKQVHIVQYNSKLCWTCSGKRKNLYCGCILHLVAGQLPDHENVP